MSFRDDGDEVVTTTVTNGKTVTTTKRKTLEHCDSCDAIINPRRNMDIEVWLNFPFSDTSIYAFCDYICLSNWAIKQIP